MASLTDPVVFSDRFYRNILDLGIGSYSWLLLIIRVIPSVLLPFSVRLDYAYLSLLDP
jgi:hypothetical protein